MSVASPGGTPAFPSPLQASLLALLGIFVTDMVARVALDVTTPTAAAGVATVIGLGAAGLLGATHVPPPHAERIGLRGLRLRHLPPLALLLPVALLAMALGPLLASWWPPPDLPERAERMREVLPTGEPLAIVESLVVAVGLAPVVEEWLFRGVIQQGLVAHLGPRAGVLVTTVLFALGHGGAGLSLASWVAAVSQAFVIGLAFGYARHVTGSLLAAVLLHAGVNGFGVLLLVLGDALAAPAPPGPEPTPAPTPAQLPWPILAGAAASVALGAWWLRRIPPAPLRPEPPAGPRRPPRIP